MRTRAGIGAILAAVALMLAGCGDDDTASPDQTSTSVTETTAAPEPPTIDELLQRDEVLNIAHAGGDQDHPHSTMYAFAESVEAGVDVLELDIWATADDVVVIHHDADTEKTAPEDLVVAETELAELQALDQAYWFSPECWPCHDRPVEEYVFRGVRTGDRPPPQGYTPEDFRTVTLEELDERFPGMPLDIEIKGEGELGLRNARALADTIERLDRADSSMVVSFDSEVIAAFHEAAPEVATSPGVAEMTDWLLAGVPLGDHHRAIQIPPAFDGIEVLTPDTLAKADEAGLAVWVWMDDAATQENEAFYRTLIDMGVDGLIVGRPATAEAAITG